MAITGIDINRDKTLIIATSKDGFAYMIDIRNENNPKVL